MFTLDIRAGATFNRKFGKLRERQDALVMFCIAVGRATVCHGNTAPAIWMSDPAGVIHNLDF